MEITDTHATFDVHINGEPSKMTYMGSFKVKVLMSPMDEINADKLYRQLLGDNMLMASDNVKNNAFVLSQLKYRVLEYDKAPFWANPENPDIPGAHITDGNVIFEVFNRAIEAQELYIKQKTEESKALEEALKAAIKSKKVEKEPELEIDETPEIDLDEE
jgi:hypothetical protein